ncbi:MAG TPA: hypothetical protein VK445_02640 [Dissulfurispiraceae bacterium]|nr:hypothetical protein [Dissulfurispiraceae bacterium]
MNPAQLLSIISALTASIWSVWTWSDEQKTKRRIHRDQAAALYINPLLVAIDELQSRLYGILEKDELAFYKKEYSKKYAFGSPAAIEILYRLSQYFGWAHRNFRYGPYTKDPFVINLQRQIGDAFENRGEFPDEAFRFSYDERVSLGNAVVRRLGEATAILPVFESIPLYQFEDELGDEASKHAALYQSKAVRRALQSIDSANDPDDLEGRERLRVLQNLLVDLLVYLEEKEGFCVSIGEHQKSRLRGIALSIENMHSPEVRVLHQCQGRVRLEIPRIKKDIDYANRLKGMLEHVEDITHVRINMPAASVIIHFARHVREMEFSSKIISMITQRNQTNA